MKKTAGAGNCPRLLLAAVLAASFFITACGENQPQEPMSEPVDLVIYTAQEEAVYQPVIKEFEERTNLRVQVETGSAKELSGRLSAEKAPDWDLVFGVGIDTLEQLKDFWLPYESGQEAAITDNFRCGDYSWTGFSTLPMVIMYNTNVVTYRELPVGWESLLEPRWKGRVAFGNPESLDFYGSALAAASYACGQRADYLERLAENLDYSTLDSISQVNAGILDGKYSVGVTMEEAAQTLRTEGADVDYIYPQEGTAALTDGTAILKTGSHPEAAEAFLDFTISTDVQRILVSPLAGLEPVERLPLIEMGLSQLSAERETAMESWNDILKAHQEENQGGGTK